MSGPILYPNVTSLPGQNGVSQADRLTKKDQPNKGEFDQAFDQAVANQQNPDSGAGPDLNHVKAPLKFSAHASQRLRDRKIALDPATLTKVNEALDKAQAKGIEDTLVLTKDAALIVSVKNRTVITAIDK